MKSLFATLVTVATLILLVINYWWLGLERPHLLRQLEAGEPFAGHVKFLIPLNHFAINYPYVLIPLVWVAAFFAWMFGASVLARLGAGKTAEAPEGKPVDP